MRRRSRAVTAARALPPGLALLRHVWKLNHAVARRSNAMERELRVSAAQRQVVRVVGAHPDLAAGELADALCIDPGTVTSLVRRLVERGLVERHHDPADHRHVWLALTPAGRALDTSTEGTVEHAAETVLAELSEDDVRAFERVIRRLTECLAR